MTDRLFRTISSGRPYHCVKTNDEKSQRIKRKILVNTRTPKRYDHQTGDGSDEKPLRQTCHICSVDNKCSHRSLESFDIEAQQSHKSASTTKPNLLRLQSKISVETNSVNSQSQLNKPRMSLLGRPVSLTHKSRFCRDAKRRKYQFLINNFLERPRGRISVLYHLFV